MDRGGKREKMQEQGRNMRYIVSKITQKHVLIKAAVSSENQSVNLLCLPVGYDWCTCPLRIQKVRQDAQEFKAGPIYISRLSF